MLTQRHCSFLVFLATLFLVLFAFLGMCNITEADVSMDGTLGPKGPLAGPNYQIPDTLGQTRGSNLFHSFDKFNINTGESATFTGPSVIRNIISRVTGVVPPV